MKNRFTHPALIATQLLVSPVIAYTCSSNAFAQNNQNAQNSRPPGFRGAIVSIANDKRSFTIVDQAGTRATIPLQQSTNYLMRRAPATFADVVKFGMEVRGTFADDGSAADVSGRGFATQPSIAQLQALMDVSDTEWEVLKPKIERVRALRRFAEAQDSGGNNGGNNNNSGNNGVNGNGADAAGASAAAPNPIREMQRTLEINVFNPSVPPGQVSSSLAALREARTQVRSELASARKELTDLVTPHQEALLVVVGLLE